VPDELICIKISKQEEDIPRLLFFIKGLQTGRSRKGPICFDVLGKSLTRGVTPNYIQRSLFLFEII